MTMVSYEYVYFCCACVVLWFPLCIRKWGANAAVACRAFGFGLWRGAQALKQFYLNYVSALGGGWLASLMG